MPHTFQNIKVWKKAHELVLKVYAVTKYFDPSERFGLTSQMRRSASSIATNIVEGYKRKSQKDFAHFLNMADSSLEETKYHLLLAHDLGYIPSADYQKIILLSDEVGRMLCGFQKAVSSRFLS